MTEGGEEGGGCDRGREEGGGCDRGREEGGGCDRASMEGRFMGALMINENNNI